ncbi:MAG: GIY-YIG nuclease family protein [Patescibacteria group bacterium]
MYYVYLLRGENDKLYVGYTGNLKRRISEHNRHCVYSSRRLLNPKLFYYEAYLEMESAKERERKIKQYGSSYHGLLKRLKIK